MQAIEKLAPVVPIAVACRAVGLSRAAVYRRRKSQVSAPARLKPRPASFRALTVELRQQVLALLHSERFCDQSVREVWATLADEGVYLCSIRTMYRILADAGEVRERREQLRHPTYTKPELLATGPNQLWSWDITKLKGSVKWTYFHLYVILDVYSRYVVGWMVAERESSELAQKLIEQTCDKQQITPQTLTLHADRGTSMTSKGVAFLLADLGVTKSHSRPQTSDDNPFSEAQFKTLKYQPSFPERFGCLEDARLFCQKFFQWYNLEHHHTGIGLLTPGVLHSGQAPQVLQQRQQVLERAYQAHPERFVGGLPVPAKVPSAVWINPPATTTTEEDTH